MKIQLGSIKMNKTGRFLKPLLKLHGEEFRRKLSRCFKLAYGMGDLLINNQYTQHIFILLDAEHENCKIFFNDFMEWFQEQDYYEDDYAVDNLLYGRLHMIVVRLPKNCEDKLQHFKKGEYSKMYTNKEVEELLEDKDKAIVIKDSNYRTIFVTKLNEQFGTDMKLKELASDAELEIPPGIDDEEEFKNIV